MFHLVKLVTAQFSYDEHNAMPRRYLDDSVEYSYMTITFKLAAVELPV